jgi:hypothetical protein
MTEIHAYQTVNVPFERIPALLTEILAACPKDDEGAAIFKLRAPIGDIVLERDATVRLIPSRSYTATRFSIFRGRPPMADTVGIRCFSAH